MAAAAPRARLACRRPHDAGRVASLLALAAALVFSVARLATLLPSYHLVEALTGFAGATRQYVVVSTVFG